ncbi:hypothetical protein Ddye_025687 [Dipteronia dyeriana]|uniref:Uncharacterized protein n=1 Tax=Dipteronia dyeriana TaxID=168575 RepID=A0AAD9WPN7_9ROSI|nr:hypothetical protein Ddye_025687 [Dipteronia dyeriana]
MSVLIMRMVIMRQIVSSDDDASLGVGENVFGEDAVDEDAVVEVSKAIKISVVEKEGDTNVPDVHGSDYEVVNEIESASYGDVIKDVAVESDTVEVRHGRLCLGLYKASGRPGPVRHNRTFSHGISEYSSSQYKKDIKKFKLLALQSIDIGSSGFSVVTNNAVQNPSSSSTEGRQTTQEIEPYKEEKDTNVSSQST